MGVHGLNLTQCAELFRAWKNDFLTTTYFAEYHGWSEKKARDIIKVGRIAHNAQAEVLNK